MSGITGFIKKNDDSEKIIKKMTDSMAHKGPDAESFCIEENITLGHRFLNQGSNELGPIKIDDYIIAFDGCIYNKEALCEELRLPPQSESAVLVEGYKTWGSDLPKKLRGGFSFVIWDIKNETLFGARDHFGLKPFYYYEGDGFVFASEIKAILEYPEYKKELNKEVLSLYLVCNFNPTYDTFFKGIKMVPPGSYFFYQNDKLVIEKYFTYEFNEEILEKEETIKEIAEVIKESVEVHLKGVEYGSFLSSGIDSSYIVSLAIPEKTYTISYEEEEYSEASYAKDLADKLGIQNISKKITKEEYLEAIPKVMYYLEEPKSDPASIAFYFACELASGDVRVVTSGEGADEFFGGYNIYQDIYKFPAYNLIPMFLRRIIAKLVSVFPEFKGRDFLIRRGDEKSYIGLNWVFKEEEVEKYLNYKPSLTLKSVTKEIYKEQDGKNPLIQMQAIDIELALIKDYLTDGDKLGKAFGIDVRTPFADTLVFNIASKLPTNAKVNKTETKVYLRSAAKSVIPNESYKKKKLGFPVPLREWMREDLYYEKIKELFDSDIANYFFVQKNIIKLLDDHKNNRKDNYKKILTIYCFLIWYQEYFGDIPLNNNDFSFEITQNELRKD